VEIREEVGADNFFLFGLSAEEVTQRRAEGYRPWEIYGDNPELKSSIDLIDSGIFAHGDTELFRPLTETLVHRDPFMLLAEYQSYVDAQTEVGHAYGDPDHWARMSILNVARMGKFSSDRSIEDYNERIWKAAPMPVDIESG
jgi:starch phosphorylase